MYIFHIANSVFNALNYAFNEANFMFYDVNYGFNVVNFMLYFMSMYSCFTVSISSFT